MQRSVVVTGGFGILGTAVADWFVSNGDLVTRIDFAQTAITDRDGMMDIGGIDLTDAAACAQTIEHIIARHGKIDILVNIAGGFVWETLLDGNIATWSRMATMNLMSAVTITKLALPHLLAQPSARIVNIGAGGAVKAAAGMGAYAASKSGVHRLTEALAEELGSNDITVNAILPSIIDTPVNRADMPDADFSTWVKPEAIAEVIGFLASTAGGAINGALIPVNRGNG